MFNYTNTWIINSATDRESGLAKWSAQDEQGTTPANFDVKRCGHFTKDNVKSIFKTSYSLGVNGKVTIAMKKGTYGFGGSGAGNYQIFLQVMLTGATAPQDSRYANDFVQKGKPYAFSIEVTDSMSTADMANAFAAQINRMAEEYGDRELIATVSSNDVVIECGDEGIQKYLLFTKAQLLQLDERRDNPARREYAEVSKGVVVNPEESFGTYDHLIRAIALPTTEHRAWLSVHEEDQPIVGGKYNQYVITMQNEVGVQGLAHVGDVVTARTTHIFYVLDSISGQFEEALKKVGEIKDSKTSVSGRMSTGKSKETTNSAENEKTAGK